MQLKKENLRKIKNQTLQIKNVEGRLFSCKDEIIYKIFPLRKEKSTE